MRPKTKLVTLHLYKYTRTEYSEVVEVPANICPSELKRLAEERFEGLDSKAFKRNQRYKKREVFVSDEGLPRSKTKASLIALRDGTGALVVREREVPLAPPFQECSASAPLKEEYTRH